MLLPKEEWIISVPVLIGLLYAIGLTCFVLMLSISGYFLCCPFVTLLITGGMNQVYVPCLSEAEVLSAPPKLVYGKLILR